MKMNLRPRVRSLIGSCLVGFVAVLSTGCNGELATEITIPQSAIQAGVDAYMPIKGSDYIDEDVPGEVTITGATVVMEEGRDQIGVEMDVRVELPSAKDLIQGRTGATEPKPSVEPGLPDGRAKGAVRMVKFNAASFPSVVGLAQPPLPPLPGNENTNSAGSSSAPKLPKPPGLLPPLGQPKADNNANPLKNLLPDAPNPSGAGPAGLTPPKNSADGAPPISQDLLPGEGKARTVEGKVTVFVGVRYDAASASFFCENAQTEKLEFEKLPERFGEIVKRVSEAAMNKYFEKNAVYQLGGDDTSIELAKATLKELSVRDGKLIAKLGI